MTLLDYATFVARSVGIDDNITRDQAKRFAQLRWKMIWDLRLWSQSLVTHTQAIPADTQEVTLTETTLDRMVNARWGTNQQVEGLAADIAFRVDPGAWTESGTFQGYVERPKDSSGRIVLRLLRAPTEAKDLLCLCKRKCPELLLDTDEPQLNGVDQALLAYTHGDVLRWLRQFSKAQMLFEEGRAHIDQMIQIDEQQAAKSQRLVPDGFDSPGSVPWR